MNFASDNTAGAHPAIMAAIAKANDGRVMPYGNDEGTGHAKDLLSHVFEKEAHVFFVPTGTAANGLALSALVPGYGAVVCHETAHINEHEGSGPALFTGGAKLLGLPGDDGKIDPTDVARTIAHGRGDPHYAPVFAASITQLTERGTAYRPDHIAAIAEACREDGVRLHMDGARFANALVGLNCSAADMTWKAGVDVVSFGATKNGALALEAVVIFDADLARDFHYRQKRAGMVLSKMRLMTAQMAAYLADDLWLENARRANAMARRLADGLAVIDGIDVTQAVDGNEVFPLIPAATVARLTDAGVAFYDRGQAPDGRHRVRLVSAFCTTAQDVDRFLEIAGNG